jgi:hypothetical protein
MGDGAHRQTAGAESVFRNIFFGKQMDSSQVIDEGLEICFPKKIFLKIRRKAAACRLPNPLYLHYLPISFFFQKTKLKK